MNHVPKINCLATDGKWYPLQLMTFSFNELQANLKKWYPNLGNNYNIVIKTLKNALISNQKELEQYFLNEKRPEVLSIKVLTEEIKKKPSNIETNFSNVPNTERGIGHNYMNTETSKLGNPQIMRRTGTSANLYLDNKFSSLSSLIQTRFDKLEAIIKNLTERIDSLEDKIMDLSILNKPSFQKIPSEICEFSGFEITKEMIKDNKFSALIELKNCSKKTFEKGYVLEQKKKQDDIISFTRKTLDQDVHQGTTNSFKIDFKLNQKIDQIHPHFIYKIFVLIKDTSQMNVGSEYPLQFYFDYHALLQNNKVNKPHRSFASNFVKNEPQQKSNQQPQQKSQQQKKPQQQQANKQAKFSDEKLKEFFDNYDLEEFVNKNTKKEDIYKIIEECDGEHSRIISVLEQNQ